MTSYRRRKQKSNKTRLGHQPPSMSKSASAPDSNKKLVDWPGDVDVKYVEDVKGRLNVIEQAWATDDIIRAFLASYNSNPRHTVEAIKKCVEWRKGRQMFWNYFRTKHERYLFLSQIRTTTKNISSTYGHAKDGRLVFYEKIGENFNLPLNKEFNETEFIDHVIVWCENLLNVAKTNAAKKPHLIPVIPYYEDEEQEKEEKDEDAEEKELPITPQFDAVDDDEDENNLFPDTGPSDVDATEQEKYKHKLSAHVFEMKHQCPYSDVIGIIDWKNVNATKFIENQNLLIAADKLISTHYPYLINRLYHINMPLNFDLITEKLKPQISEVTLKKSIFLESDEIREKRQEYMKKNKYKRKPRSSRRNNRLKKTEKEAAETEEDDVQIAELDDESKNELLMEISSSSLPKEYGGEIKSLEIFNSVDPFFCSLVGVSSEDDPSGYEQYTENKDEWTAKPLDSNKRHTERINVVRGQHFKWEYTAQYDRNIIFGVEFEADGFRGKAIKVIVRHEQEEKCGYFPNYGDFIVLKDGKLIFQFRNPARKRLNLQFKITSNKFPTHFIHKFLPDYAAEESLLQTKTLQIGGKNHHYNQHRNTKKSPSEYSGTTATSTSPPPAISPNNFTPNTTATLLSVEDNTSNDRKKNLKKTKSARHKKSNKSRNKKKKNMKRSRTPEPGQQEY